MSHLLEIALGIGLAAATGFRVFVPLALLGLAARFELLTLASGFAWIGSTPALVILATACLLEIGAYYIPWVDNLLDTIATPAAVVAGVTVSAAVMADLSPELRWTLALIAGGGVAGLVQGSTVVARQASSLATLGLGNFALATAEALLAFFTTALAILVPLFVLVLLGVLVLWRVRRHREAVT
ncbi:MAG: DUF4126 family protein [Thermoanaerobaculia bacterium]|nr:DUF4126 family protein [Thermoanaerobaculia bacterium]MCZ7650752.1 DUF4126 domain-containing protein [Thermoanaerobaculia bacterium]